METETEIETNHIIDFSDRLFKLALGAVVVAAVFFAGYVIYQFSSLPQNMPHEITVSGDGQAFGKPDIALVSFGVTSEAAKSQDAVNQNNTKMNAVIKAVKDLGVADKDIQTTAYNLSPQYDYTARGSVFKGYQLEQQISVKIRNFDNISTILDGATSQGVTNVGNLQFKIDDPETVQAQARSMAITKAKAKLQDILKQSGLEVGKLVNISEGYNSTPQPMYAQASGLMKDAANVAPQIQSGQQKVDATVTLTYQVK